MPRTAREQSTTGIYHVMIRGINCQDIFEEPDYYRKIIQTLASLKCAGLLYPDACPHGYVPLVLMPLM